MVWLLLDNWVVQQKIVTQRSQYLSRQVHQNYRKACKVDELKVGLKHKSLLLQFHQQQEAESWCKMLTYCDIFVFVYLPGCDWNVAGREECWDIMMRVETENWDDSQLGLVTRDTHMDQLQLYSDHSKWGGNISRANSLICREFLCFPILKSILVK